MAFYFSSDTKALYDTDVFPVDSLPENKVEISAAVYSELLTKQNQGYVILADGSGNPYTVNQSEATATDMKHSSSVATTLALGHVKIGTTMTAANDGTLDLKDGAVSTAKIANANVTAEKIATDAVETSKIKNANVTTDKIADGAVSELKLDDSAVTRNKIATGAVVARHISNGEVTGDKLATSAVGTQKIANGAVTESKLGEGAVTRQKLANDFLFYDPNFAAHSSGPGVVYGYLGEMLEDRYDSKPSNIVFVTNNAIPFGLNNQYDNFTKKIGYVNGSHILVVNVCSSNLTVTDENGVTLKTIPPNTASLFLCIDEGVADGSNSKWIPIS